VGQARPPGQARAVSDAVYQAIFHVAAVLELPVVIVALLALATVIVELGAFLVEVRRRRRRRFSALSTAGESARRLLDEGDRSAAGRVLESVAWSAGMGRAFDAFVTQAGRPGADTRIAKELADFDFDRQRRLGRTRLLVRVGPALGLMGTLIPLSPALDGLARGNVAALTENLRVAFSVTVLGLLIGAVAFALSLTRDRMYGQDYSDLEFVAALLTDDATRPAPSPSPSSSPPTEQESTRT
jgi:biopolymer transport protein ExbB/TolQ